MIRFRLTIQEDHNPAADAEIAIRATVQTIVFAGIEQDIVALIAAQIVRIRAAIEKVVAMIAEQKVVAGAAI